MLETRAFQRKPFVVQAVQVTLENMPEVVKWCGGNLRQDDLHRPYIKVEVHRAANPKQTMAYEGDWVLISNTGARVYTDYAFNKSFEPIGATVDPYQQTQSVFDLPGVDRKEVVEKPVGDEKLVQGESVETVVEGVPSGYGGKRFRTPEELRKDKQVPEIWPPSTDLSIQLHEAWVRSQGHDVAENPDQPHA